MKIGATSVLVKDDSFEGLEQVNSTLTLYIFPAGTSAMNMASQIGAAPKIAGLVVVVPSINTFILPTHLVNALMMEEDTRPLITCGWAAVS